MAFQAAREDLEKSKKKGEERLQDGLEVLKEELIPVLNQVQTNDIVRLMVGGKKFYVSKTTLLATPGFNPTFFSVMLSDKWTIKPFNLGKDFIFIDRDPSVFHLVIDYLREGRVPLNALTPRDKAALLSDARFYRLQGILDEEEQYQARKISFLPALPNNEGQPTYFKEGKSFVCIRPNYGDWTVALGNLAVTSGVWNWEIELRLQKEEDADEEGQDQGEKLEIDTTLQAYIGIAPYNVHRYGPIFNDFGWWLHYDGTVDGGRRYFDEGIKKEGKDEATVEIHLDMDRGILSFSLDGRRGGPAYENLPSGIPLSLCVVSRSNVTILRVKGN